MIETTEVRWFGNGPLPPSVSSWFTNDGRLGVVEERCDVYRLDRRSDVGVKLRARSTLELKVRQSSAESLFTFGGTGQQLRGVVEVWRKWSPADGLVSREFETTVEVWKTVVKRRFRIDGEEDAEPALSDPPPGPFCDVEIVAVDDGVTEVWTFAFAAQGPPGTRRAAIDAAWRAVAPPDDWAAALTTSCGYPELLEGPTAR